MWIVFFLIYRHGRFSVLIDQLHLTSYNQSREVPIVLLEGERVGRDCKVPRT